MEKIPVKVIRISFRSVETNIILSVRMTGTYDKMRMEEAAIVLADIHPSLKYMVVVDKEGVVQYDYNPSLLPKVIEFENHVEEMISREAKYTFDYEQECLLRIAVKEENTGFTIVMTAHHLLGDARSVFILLDDYIKLYTQQKEISAVHEPCVLEHIGQIEGAPGLSKKLDYYVSMVNKKWQKEKHIFTKEEYVEMRRNYFQNHQVAYECVWLDNEKTELLKKLCKQEGVTITAFLFTALGEVIGSDWEGVERIVMELPVSLKQEMKLVQERAVGNFCSKINFQYECNREKSFWDRARAVYEMMQQKLSSSEEKYVALNMLMSVDGTLQDSFSFVTNGLYDSLLAKQTAQIFGFGNSSFNLELSNIGAVTINNPNIKELAYIPPLADMNLTIGAIGYQNQLSLCLVYDKKRYNRQLIRKTLEKLTMVERYKQ